ncbi:MAG: M13 family metallopeptidase [Lachnospiraceae bacterium]|nr:M13 family metallopeptidase [Lachnospiraceae bacterium]
MKDIIKRATAVILAAVLVFPLWGCEDITDEINESLAAGSHWVDSDLYDSIDADTKYRPQDDFAASVNKDWKLSQTKYYDIFDDVLKAVYENKKRIVTDETIGGGRAGELIRNYYNLASDWEARDGDGVAPLQKYVDDIASIQTRQELFDFICDLSRNPISASPFYIDVSSIGRSSVYEGSYYVALTSPYGLLQEDPWDMDTYYAVNEHLERFEMIKDIAVYYLKRLGYDEAYAGELVNRSFRFEKKLLQADSRMIESDEEATYNRDEVLAMAGDFPLDAFLKARGFTENDIFVCNDTYLKKLSALFGTDRLEEIKSYLILRYIFHSLDYLDNEGYEAVKELSKDRQEPEEEDPMQEEIPEYDTLYFDEYIGGTPMVGAMDQLYVENFFDDTSISDLKKLTGDLINAYKVIFAAEDWLSEEGKEACLKKLEAMSVNVAYPDFDSLDYSQMELVTRENGGNFLEAYFAADRFLMKHLAWLSTKEYDRYYWDPLDTELSTTITNAMYYPVTNGIYIFAGICEAPTYSRELSYEEKLAGIGVIVGHEITHGFDNTGALYNMEGEEESWLPVEDQQAFNDRCDNVSFYYSDLTPFPGAGFYTGSNVVGEATADMGGMKAALFLGAKEKDFDYELFFRHYARVWRANVSLDSEQEIMTGDPHPLPFYRINVAVQQYEEFYETFDVKEGDRMYLAPEKRISVW